MQVVDKQKKVWYIIVNCFDSKVIFSFCHGTINCNTRILGGKQYGIYAAWNRF